VILTSTTRDSFVDTTDGGTGMLETITVIALILIITALYWSDPDE
jgi:hypothetical protein